MGRVARRPREARDARAPPSRARARGARRARADGARRPGRRSTRCASCSSAASRSSSCAPTGRRYGKVFVATIEAARGLAFDVVFVPGLAEKLFPQKIVEDPLLLDDARARARRRARRRTTTAPPTSASRSASRSARPRDASSSRIRASTSSRRARGCPRSTGSRSCASPRASSATSTTSPRARAKTVDARIGWPAPEAPRRRDRRGRVRPRAARVRPREDGGATRRRGALPPRRQRPPRARAALPRASLAEALDGRGRPRRPARGGARRHPRARARQRSFSPTALQNFAACPYRFFLPAVHRLAPREEPEAIEELDPLTRGSLVHEVQFDAPHRSCATKGLLPGPKPRLDAARDVLDVVLAEVARAEHERLSPAIERVWDDAIAGHRRRPPRVAAPHARGARLDARVLRALVRPRGPPRSRTTRARTRPVAARRGHPAARLDRPRRADDAGRAPRDRPQDRQGRARRRATSSAAARSSSRSSTRSRSRSCSPGARSKEGRLYYCTAAGDFTKVDVPLDDEARAAARLVAKTIGDALSTGFLPAAPAKDACRYCDFDASAVRTRRSARSERSKDRLKRLARAAEAASERRRRSSLDHEARARIANDLDATLVVEAAAGTGKTTALVERIVALLRTGRRRCARSSP